MESDPAQRWRRGGGEAKKNDWMTLFRKGDSLAGTSPCSENSRSAANAKRAERAAWGPKEHQGRGGSGDSKV